MITATEANNLTKSYDLGVKTLLEYIKQDIINSCKSNFYNTKYYITNLYKEEVFLKNPQSSSLVDYEDFLKTYEKKPGLISKIITELQILGYKVKIIKNIKIYLEISWN